MPQSVFRANFDTFSPLSLHDLEIEYVLLSEPGNEPSDEWVSQTVELLRQNRDVAVVGTDTQVPDQTFEDVAWPLDGGVQLIRAATLRRLVEKGFHPVYRWDEIDCALRVSGWRILGQNVARSHPEPRGRSLATRELYGLALESVLASGPRSIRLSSPFRLAKSLARMALRLGSFYRPRHHRKTQSLSIPQEVDYARQVVLTSLDRTKENIRRSGWRESSFGSSFSGSTRASTVVLLFTATRPFYLRRALRALRTYWPDHDYRLVVTQDGNDSATEALVKSLGENVSHWRFNETVSIPVRDWLGGAMPYFRIAQHFSCALERVFHDTSVQQVIVLEDDMEISGDFFPYFRRLAEVLTENPDLLTASAWNDNGTLAADATAVHRTDCFPGCGWLLQRRGWEILSERWPQSHWDDALRQDTALQAYQHLRPEMSRIVNFGNAGTGSRDFFQTFVYPVKCQLTPVEWSNVSLELSYETYRDDLLRSIASSLPFELHPSPGHNYYLIYHGPDEFQRLAEKLEILPEFRPWAPRASFEGIVILNWGEGRLYLLPRPLGSKLGLARSSAQPHQQ